MNNGTKSANIMSYRRYRKLFNPTPFSTTDSIFGTKSTIVPTMHRAGFKRMTIFDIDDEYDYKLIKPIEIVKDKIDVFKFTYIVYHVWKWRDLHGRGIDIFYI